MAVSGLRLGAEALLHEDAFEEIFDHVEVPVGASFTPP